MVVNQPFWGSYTYSKYISKYTYSSKYTSSKYTYTYSKHTYSKYSYIKYAYIKCTYSKYTVVINTQQSANFWVYQWFGVSAQQYTYSYT